MTTTTPSARERQRQQQRVQHLVLARPRPVPALPPRPKHMPKAEWKLRRAELLRAGATLLPGVEEAVALREEWSHKQGTPETHEHLRQAQQRPGSLARLLASGAIDRDQLAAATDIAEAYRAITADVRVRTASFETRIEGGRHGRAEEEQLGRVHADLAYSWWRDAVGARGDMLLAVIVHDVGLTIAARHAGLSMPRARRALTDALDLWRQARRRTGRAAAAIAG